MNKQDVHRILLGWLPAEWQDCIGTWHRYSLTGAPGIGHPIICRIDGTTFHGGLTDRWKGIVSLYALAKATQRGFRLYYTYPFDLTDYQIPALYDWRLSDGEMSGNIRNVCLKRVVADPTLQRVINLPRSKQIHCYANRDWLDLINTTYGTHYVWGELFRELFKPSAYLSEALTPWLQRLNEPFIAVAFRTQNIFGDYTEYQYRAADQQRQDEVLHLCHNYLHRLHDQTGKTLLVTSDSLILSQSVQSLPFVVTTIGQAAHADTVADATKQQYCKSFIDFYLLAQAEQVICAGTREMYPSDFPRYAAKIYDKPFQRVSLEESVRS